MKQKISIFASAKLNLFLEVGTKAPDDYHDLKTIFLSIDCFDHLYFDFTKSSENSEKCKITIESSNGPYKDLLPLDKSNLIYKAAKLFNDQTQFKGFELQVKIDKKIPIAGGLAGGSADAAATLRALNYFYGDPVAQSELLSLARQLGSDVPFCLLGGCMLGTGRGDQLIRLPFVEELFFIIVIPPSEVRLTAREVYQQFDVLSPLSPQKDVSIEKFIEILLTKKADTGKYLFNSLEEAVISKSFWVDEVKSFIDSRGFRSLVSGSGPTVFTMSPNHHQAINLQNELNLKGYNAVIHRPTAEAFQMIVHE
jgi:4-diphosphocytidyl-2C-methyl-D-erythritol kinase